MSRRRLSGRVGPVHVLVAVAVLEVAVNRIAVDLLRPAHGAPPTWHKLLDYTALFLSYFTGTLASAVLGQRIVTALRGKRGLRDATSQVALAIAGLLAAVPMIVAVPSELTFALEVAFAVAVVAVVVAGLGRDRDLGGQLGLIVIAIPLLAHTVAVVGDTVLWSDGVFDARGVSVARAGLLALCMAALLSPYVFAPRPFSRAVTKPGPVVVAMAIAALGAVAARLWYPTIADAARRAIGVKLETGQADPRLALYLLAVATLAWTLGSCAIAASAARRQIGLGVGLIVLGGYGFQWPQHYLLPLLGMALVGDAVRRVRDEELSALPITGDTPPIDDAAWSRYVGAVTTGLKRTLGDVHSLSTRGDDGVTSTLIVGEDPTGMQVKTRIERIEGSVLALDVAIGREIDEVRGATLTLWAIPARNLGVNPSGPPAAPTFRVGDLAFDERFRTRGSALAVTKLLDDGLRARAVASLDGWLAYWEADGLRYRVYPGRGAPLDHPIPLSDLAVGRVATADRLVAVIELLVAIALRGVAVAPAQPSALGAQVGE